MSFDSFCQGKGRPVLSIDIDGIRHVLVGGQVVRSAKWLTYHEFLADYIKQRLGVAWGNAEMLKPFADRHPALVWYEHYFQSKNRSTGKVGSIQSSPMTGGASSYLNLAYDLHTLEHNLHLQDRLLRRLRDRHNFEGARYEAFVAATLIRAGFELTLEDETDGRTTHVEFAAKFTRTGRTFSVEAKHRAGKKFRVGRHLQRALVKRADHERIVFMDINVPDGATHADLPRYLKEAVEDLRAFEHRLLNGNPLPEAYVVITNAPWHHHLLEIAFRCAVIVEGFHLDLKYDATFPTTAALAEYRARHGEVFDLLDSMELDSEIPATFDGRPPELAFANRESR